MLSVEECVAQLLEKLDAPMDFVVGSTLFYKHLVIGFRHRDKTCL